MVEAEEKTLPDLEHFEQRKVATAANELNDHFKGMFASLAL